MYETILVPTDGSDVAESAFEHALSIAELAGASVHALYVVDLEAASYGLDATQIEHLRAGELDDLPEIRARAEEATGRIAAAAADRGIDVVEATEVGDPPERIVDYAERSGVDLAVMASHGRSGVSRLLLGSVTERVVRTADFPVLVVNVSTTQGVEGSEPG